MKKSIPKYLVYLIKNNPQIKSGRRNYYTQHNRVLKQIHLIIKYFKTLNL